MPVPKLKEVLDVNKGTIFMSLGLLLVLLAVIFNKFGYIFLNLFGIFGVILEALAVRWEFKKEVDLSVKKTQFFIILLGSIILLIIINLVKMSL